MRFYVSWYPGDPWYPLYDDDCAMLISITSVSREWTPGDFAELPRYLMLDSGGYRFANAPSERPTPREVFERQSHLIEGYGIKGILCAFQHKVVSADQLAAPNKEHLYTGIPHGSCQRDNIRIDIFA